VPVVAGGHSKRRARRNDQRTGHGATVGQPRRQCVVVAAGRGPAPLQPGPWLPGVAGDDGGSELHRKKQGSMNRLKR